MRRVFHLLGRLVGGLAVLGVPAALAWLHWVGFSPEWREKVADAIGGSRLSVEIGRLTFNPFHGIVAEGVDVSEKSGNSRRLADIDRLALSLNITDLLRGRIAIDMLELEHAVVSIPFADDGIKPDAIELSNLNAAIVQTGGRLTIRRGECDLLGIHVSLSGDLLNVDTRVARPASRPADVTARAAAIRSALDVRNEIRFSGRPELSLRFSGDLSKPEMLTMPRVEFRAEGVVFRDLNLGRIALHASYADKAVRLTKLTAAGPTGDVTASGGWDFSRGGEIAISGRVAPGGILKLVGDGRFSGDLSFEQLPRVDARVICERTQAGFDALVSGRVATGPFSVKGVSLRDLRAAFAWRDAQLYVQDAEIEATTGTVQVSVLRAEDGSFRMKLDSDAAPTEFSALFGPNERKIIDLMEFADPPRVVMALAGASANMDVISGSGTIVLGRTAMRGSWIDSGNSRVVIEDRAVLYENFTVEKAGRRATGSFTYDFGRREVRLDGIRSGLQPAEVLMWVDPRIAATVAVYRFRSPPNVLVDGLVHMKDPAKNDLRIDVDAPGGVDYELLNRDLEFGALKALVNLKGQRVLANVRNAALMGGEVSVDANVSTDPASPVFGASIGVAGVDFPSLTNLYFGYSRSEGRMSGSYEFTAKLRDPGSMRGEGSIRVEEGHVLAIPLFGPLSEIISTIIPGAGHDGARLATADFTIADNRVSTRNLDIEGEGFEMFGEGSIGFPKGDLDMAIRINAKGIPGIVLFPVSKLFEYVSTGTMSDPQWRPKIVPKEFFDILGMGGNGPDKPRKPTITR